MGNDMNEPVLWMDNEGNYWHENVGHFNIPLYTHPVKELTDEEIIETVKNYFIGAIKVGIVLTNDNVLDFAKAILRKAQEK